MGRNGADDRINCRHRRGWATLRPGETAGWPPASQPPAGTGSAGATNGFLARRASSVSAGAATEGTKMDPNYIEFLTSAQGRVSRAQFWLKWVVPYVVVTFVLFFVVTLILPQSVASIIMGLYGLAALWPSIAIYIKRAHDRGRSGWFILLGLVPLVNIWVLIELLFLPGTSGENTYGVSPVPAAA
jgi:uncharacterized membrane protein YhaH (DUF805 family)